MTKIAQARAKPKPSPWLTAEQIRRTRGRVTTAISRYMSHSDACVMLDLRTARNVIAICVQAEAQSAAFTAQAQSAQASGHVPLPEPVLAPVLVPTSTRGAYGMLPPEPTLALALDRARTYAARYAYDGFASDRYLREAWLAIAVGIASR